MDSGKKKKPPKSHAVSTPPKAKVVLVFKSSAHENSLTEFFAVIYFRSSAALGMNRGVWEGRRDKDREEEQGSVTG